jgi:hypothetical protein
MCHAGGAIGTVCVENVSHGWCCWHWHSVTHVSHRWGTGARPIIRSEKKKKTFDVIYPTVIIADDSVKLPKSIREKMSKAATEVGALDAAGSWIWRRATICESLINCPKLDLTRLAGKCPVSTPPRGAATPP